MKSFNHLQGDFILHSTLNITVYKQICLNLPDYPQIIRPQYLDENAQQNTKYDLVIGYGNINFAVYHSNWNLIDIRFTCL